MNLPFWNKQGTLNSSVNLVREAMGLSTFGNMGRYYVGIGQDMKFVIILHKVGSPFLISLFSHSNHCFIKNEYISWLGVVLREKKLSKSLVVGGRHGVCGPPRSLS